VSDRDGLGLLGTGRLGFAVARRLLRSGHGLTVYNRDARKAHPLRDLGAAVAGSPADVASGCDTLLICVTDHDAVERLCWGPSGVVEAARAGMVVIDLSTVGPAQAAGLADRLRQAGIAYVDCPVSGGPAAAEAGTLTALMSGDRDACRRVEGIVAVLAKDRAYLGAAGRAQVAKVVNNALESIHLAAGAEIVRLAEASGLGIDELRWVVSHARGGSVYLDVLLDYLSGVTASSGASLDVRRKDLRLARDLAGATTSTPLLAHVDALLARAGDRTGGDADQCELARHAPPTTGDAPLVLMNPGPVVVHDRVRAALAGPDLCHRDEAFTALMQRVLGKIVLACGGGDEHAAVALTGSGTAAVEAAICSVVPAGGKLLVVENGHYGERMTGMAAAYGIACERLTLRWGQRVDPQAVEALLAADPGITHLAVVHHETTTGILNPLGALSDVARRHGCAVIVDAVSSLGCEPLDVRADGIDWCVGTANKCLEGLPGVSFVCAPRGHFEALATLPRRSVYLDLHGHYEAQNERRQPLFTPAIPAFYALDVALDLYREEGGRPGRSGRYGRLAEKLRTGMERIGLELWLPPELRSRSMTTVRLPGGLDFDALSRPLRQAGFVIYPGQGPMRGSVFRVANMGRISAGDVDRFLQALADVVMGPSRSQAG
jgi:2-aminoethylphosphonate-pyruvate transaminase